MKDYETFLKKKLKSHIKTGFTITENQLNPKLYDFQKFIVSKCLEIGRAAVFADCGLGKTPIQLEWSYQVAKKTGKPVLILTPLAVRLQTMKQGEDIFNIECKKYDGSNFPIQISNYEQLENIDYKKFAGVVLDESSILKNYTGSTKKKLIEYFSKTKYKLCCTATPSPNDLNEIGNHSEFLNIMDANNMRMRWFVRDEGMNNYRLKGHSENDFYEWISSWAVCLRNPEDIGYDGSKFILPKLKLIEKKILIPAKEESMKLFNDVTVNATSFNQELRITIIERLDEVKNIISKNKNENFIVWVKQNVEADKLKELIPDSVEVRGDESTEAKESKLIAFAENKYKVLITKSKIAQFGLNFQNCNNQIFASLDFSFEQLYQSIRRSYRFGQKKEVNIYIITTDTMENVISTIKVKQENYEKLMSGICNSVNKQSYKLKIKYNMRKAETDSYTIINGDCVEEIKTVESDSVDFSVFSPPFSNLFIYSDNIRDMGNCSDHDEFYNQSKYLLKELYRIIRPGRLVAVHTKDLAVYKNSSGYSGLYNFTSKYHDLMESVGFKYHSKITIWIDPVLEMQRTKTQRLLYKQVTSDSSYSGIGMPEYVTIFRKWEGNEDEWKPITNLDKSNFNLDTWQKWASPVWFDISRTDVLNSYRDAKDYKDEKHIAPLQLEVIKRLIHLYTNENELVFSPFAGIGSEIYQAVKLNRKGLGIELKESYFDTMKKNLENCIKEKEAESNQYKLIV